MDDIVTRLENADYEDDPSFLMDQAAFEIMSLRSEVQRLRALLKMFGSAWQRSEFSDGSSSEYFSAVHTLLKEVHGE